MQPPFPATRPRRLRRTPALRDLVREQTVTPQDLILPVFVEEGLDDPLPIAAMPGVLRIPERRLAREVEAIARDGVRSLMLFGISHNKDEVGRDTLRPDGLVARMTRAAKDAAPELVVIPDLCFCEYTDHGHCGIVEGGTVANDATAENLGRQAVVAVEAGADMVAPSAMMDGQVAAIRRALDAAGHPEAPVMAYSSKFASAFYGPFRAAAGCELKGDRKTYQMDAANRSEALLEVALDLEEGADMVMVKPAMSYLDIVRDVADMADVPVSAYQISGEYAMIEAAAAHGWIDRKASIVESVLSIRRAGADSVLTYWAAELGRWMKEGSL